MINAQNYYTLKLFRSLSRKFQPAFLLNCSKEFIRFLCECIVNLIEGNLTGVRKNQFVRFQKQLRKLTSKSTTINCRRLIFGSKAGITILGYIYQPCMNKFSTFFNSEVKKFVLVPKELWETRKRKLPEPSSEIYKKEETFFPVIKKAKEEISSEKTHLKNLRQTCNFTISTVPRHWKLWKKFTKTNGWKFHFPIQLLLTTLTQELI